ncbi:MAG TPA: hypothetical protein VFS10_16955 [Pyrinomonadaceae bacterium]|nr:hypothetical protein [Pyrinomonadaceae bacterium]
MKAHDTSRDKKAGTEAGEGTPPSDKPLLSEKEIEALIIQRQRSKVREFSDKLFTFKGWLIASALMLVYFLGLAALIEPSLYRKVWFYVSVLPSALLTGAVVILIVRGALRLQEKALDRQTVFTDTNKLQEKLEEDFFTNLVKINFKYIDKYYLQTQVQADRSFYLSGVAAVFAFGVIITGVVMMYQGKVQQGYVVAASGILGEFIASVFFYLYNRTVIKMGEYHQKLVLTQNIGLALKIADGLPTEAQVDVKKNLVEYLSKDINAYLTRPLSDDGREGTD